MDDHDDDNGSNSGYARKSSIRAALTIAFGVP
jgi:hypothetical protein